jgi:hypothetical protein
LLVVASIGATALAAAGVFAQGLIWRGGYGYTAPPRFPTASTFQGDFNFCRLMFRSDHREKRGWSTDYPGADINLSVRLQELTKAPVTMASADLPEHVVVRATDEALFKCPFVLVEDGGTAVFSDAEVVGLRDFLLKGGFLFVSDYWGPWAREQWDEQIGRVLPPSQYPIVEVGPEHALWHMMYDVPTVPQMPSIQSWRRSGGTTERGVRPGLVEARGIADERGRLMVLMLHDTDVPDGWEREGEDHEYFARFSPDAYAVGINVVLYAMTH